MPEAIFSDRARLGRRFSAGLAAMLQGHEGLGVYILVLANALQDAGLWAELRGPLARRHALLADRIGAALRAGRKLAEPDDDLMVFLKLMAIGFDALAPVEHARLPGPDAGRDPVWELQFNPVRALRPARMSDAPVAGIMAPFDARGFHFNKPFLAKEVLWEGVLEDKPARLLYNKFPFAPLHGLLVPEPARERPQCLTPELHGWAWAVAESLAAAVPGFCLAYNSYGAYASVNHLHFQTFVRDVPLPAQAAPQGPYPLARQFFDDPQAAWMQLDACHEAGQVYNLIYADDGLLVLPRMRQGEAPVPPWSAGFAWSEVAGVFPVASREDYEALDHAALSQLLARVAA
jgi:diadenosine tetraphosphate (Ap4A) HIT family hydrolase